MRVDYFMVVANDFPSSIGLGRAMDAVLRARPQVAGMQVGDVFATLHSIQTIRNMPCFKFSKFRFHDVPDILDKTTGIARQIGFANNNEGLGEYTYVVFSPSYRYCAVVYNHHGVKATVISEYLKKFCEQYAFPGMNPAFSVQIVPLSADNYRERIREFNRITKIETTFGEVESGPDLSSILPPTEAKALESLKKRVGPIFRKETLTPHKGSSLRFLGTIKYFLKLSQLRFQNRGVLSSRIEGFDANGEKIKLTLDEMIYSTTLSLNRPQNQRNLPDATIFGEVIAEMLRLEAIIRRKANGDAIAQAHQIPVW